MRKWPYIVMALLAAMIGLLQVQLDQAKQARPELRRGLFVPPRPEVFKVVLMGYHLVAADMYWLGAIQYFSDCVDENTPPEDLYPMTDFITDLDPRFCTSYYFAGLNMSMEGANPQHAVDLLEKGKDHCPQNFRIPFTAGYIYYFNLHQPEKAAENLEESNRIHPNESFALLAARLRAQGGSPEMGISFLEQMIKSTDDEWARQRFLERIRELQAEIGERELTKLVKQYQQQTGQTPQSLDELVRPGWLKGIPAHPVPGHHFFLSPHDGRVKTFPPLEQLRVYSFIQGKTTEPSEEDHHE